MLESEHLFLTFPAIEHTNHPRSLAFGSARVRLRKSVARLDVHRVSSLCLRYADPEHGLPSDTVSFREDERQSQRDLGIHLHVNRLPVFGFGALSVEDREIRRRVFWSAFTWDKVRHLIYYKRGGLTII